MTNYLLRLHSTQTSDPQHNNNKLLLKNRNPNPIEKIKQNQKMRKGLMNRDSHIHVQGPLTTTCIVLTNYHNIPTALSSA
jgi:hypothetical protein